MFIYKLLLFKCHSCWIVGMVVAHYYCWPGVASGALSRKVRELKALSPLVESLSSELCYNVELQEPLSSADEQKLRWLLSSPLQPEGLQLEPHLVGKRYGSLLIEIGPRFCIKNVFIIFKHTNGYYNNLNGYSVKLFDKLR